MSTIIKPSDHSNQMWTNRTIICLVAIIMCMLTLFMYIHEEIPKPYMDEQFHVDQLHAYCAGNFSYVSKFFFDLILV